MPVKLALKNLGRFCVVSSVWAACATGAGAEATTPPLPAFVVNTGVPSYSPSRGILVRWIGNNKLLILHPVIIDGKPDPDGQSALTLYDPSRQPRARELQRSRYLYFFCIPDDGGYYYEERLSYEPTDVRGIRVDSNERLVEVERPPGYKGGNSARLDCPPRFPIPIKLNSPADRGFLLKPQHGFVFRAARGSHLEHGKYYWLRPGSDVPARLPFPDDDRIDYTLDYLPWRDAYYFSAHVTILHFRRELPACLVSWLVYPDGRTETLCIPDSLPDRVRPWMTGKGLLFTRSLWIEARQRRDPESGVYAMIGGKPKKLLHGDFQYLEVSPDGCKVAFPTPRFDTAPLLRLEGEPKIEPSLRVHVLDLCRHWDELVASAR